MLNAAVFVIIQVLECTLAERKTCWEWCPCSFIKTNKITAVVWVVSECTEPEVCFPNIVGLQYKLIKL